MQARRRENAGGFRGMEPASERGTPPLAGAWPHTGLRGALRLVLATPTFAASVGVLLAAVLAYGTTQTSLIYSGMAPPCASVSCSASPGRTAGGQPMRVSAVPATAPGGTGGSGATTSRPAGARAAMPGRTAGPRAADRPRRAAGTARAWPGVLLSYRTLRDWPGGFVGAITITGARRPAIQHWRLWIHYAQDRISLVWNARWYPSVTAATRAGVVLPRRPDQAVRPGQRVQLTFLARGAPGPPDACAFNGHRCSFAGHRPAPAARHGRHGGHRHRGSGRPRQRSH